MSIVRYSIARSEQFQRSKTFEETASFCLLSFIRTTIEAISSIQPVYVENDAKDWLFCLSLSLFYLSLFYSYFALRCMKFVTVHNVCWCVWHVYDNDDDEDDDRSSMEFDSWLGMLHAHPVMHRCVRACNRTKGIRLRRTMSTPSSRWLRVRESGACARTDGRASLPGRVACTVSFARILVHEFYRALSTLAALLVQRTKLTKERRSIRAHASDAYSSFSNSFDNTVHESEELDHLLYVNRSLRLITKYE